MMDDRKKRLRIAAIGLRRKSEFWEVHKNEKYDCILRAGL